MAYCMYLRKSRQDIEAESRGQGETLSTHFNELTRFAHSLGISVHPDHVYRELGSADTISERPLMQRLLQEVQTGKWEGVFCRYADRLSRGDSIDQGMVALAFKASGTRILTPEKIYDPLNDMDEEFFEFSLFMSRREYKLINRRLQAGREASVRAGNYVGGKRVYGYEVVKRTGAKGYTLRPIPEEAEVVRQIFAWRLNDGMTPTAIAARLNALAIPNFSGSTWNRAYVYHLLRNPVYCGYVQWKKRESRMRYQSGTRTINRPLSPNYIRTKGVHEPLITEEQYQQSLNLFEKCNLHSHVSSSYEMKNPLSGLLYCPVCGYSMTRKVCKSGTYYSCRTANCTNSGTRTELVVDAVLDALRSWVRRYSASAMVQEKTSQPNQYESAISLAQSSLATAEKQLTTARDMLERGVYSVDEFLQRRDVLNRKIASIREEIATLENKSLERSPEDIIRASIPKIIRVLEAWPSCTTASEQNALLRTVISRITLSKTVVGNRAIDSRDLFSLVLYPNSDV